jgi:hypothetical protein
VRFVSLSQGRSLSAAFFVPFGLRTYPSPKFDKVDKQIT